ncbi:MAG: HypC/HybG/HupF family hydrogenase formation chaperone [Actinomycetota bacterium]|nr:HypC/HybG/HupF family hydrogenase formation chaperone [Actinomycetota bacterium]
MCLSVPGQITELDVDGHGQVALADVVGISRRVHVGMLEDGQRVSEGDWILIHMGCALAKIDEAEADRLLGRPARQ